MEEGRVDGLSFLSQILFLETATCNILIYQFSESER